MTLVSIFDDQLDVIDVADVADFDAGPGEFARPAPRSNLANLAPPAFNAGRHAGGSSKEEGWSSAAAAAKAKAAQVDAPRPASAGLSPPRSHPDPKPSDDAVDDSMSAMTIDARQSEQQQDGGVGSPRRCPQHQLPRGEDLRLRQPVLTQTRGCSTSEASTAAPASGEFKGFHAGKGPCSNIQRPLEHASAPPPEAVDVKDRRRLMPSQSQASERTSENDTPAASASRRRRSLHDRAERRADSNESVGGGEKSTTAGTPSSGAVRRRHSSLHLMVREDSDGRGWDGETALVTEGMSTTVNASGDAEASVNASDDDEASENIGKRAVGESRVRGAAVGDPPPPRPLHNEAKRLSDLELQAAQLNLQLAQIQSEFDASQLEVRKLAGERDDSRAKLEAAEAENEKLRRQMGEMTRSSERECLLSQIRGTRSGGNYVHCLEGRLKPMDVGMGGTDESLVGKGNQARAQTRTTRSFGKQPSQDSLFDAAEFPCTSKKASAGTQKGFQLTIPSSSASSSGAADTPRPRRVVCFSSVDDGVHLRTDCDYDPYDTWYTKDEYREMTNRIRPIVKAMRQAREDTLLDSSRGGIDTTRGLEHLRSNAHLEQQVINKDCVVEAVLGEQRRQRLAHLTAGGTTSSIDSTHLRRGGVVIANASRVASLWARNRARKFGAQDEAAVRVEAASFPDDEQHKTGQKPPPSSSSAAAAAAESTPDDDDERRRRRLPSWLDHQDSLKFTSRDNDIDIDPPVQQEAVQINVTCCPPLDGSAEAVNTAFNSKRSSGGPPPTAKKSVGPGCHYADGRTSMPRPLGEEPPSVEQAFAA